MCLICVQWNNCDTVPFTGACHADELLYLFVNSNMDTLLTESDRQVFGCLKRQKQKCNTAFMGMYFVIFHGTFFEVFEMKHIQYHKFKVVGLQMINWF